MKTKGLKALALILSLVMVVTAMPATLVFADAPDAIIQIDGGKEVDSSKPLRAIATIAEFSTKAELLLGTAVIDEITEKNQTGTTYIFEGTVPSGTSLGANSLSLRVDGDIVYKTAVSVYTSEVVAEKINTYNGEGKIDGATDWNTVGTNATISGNVQPSINANANKTNQKFYVSDNPSTDSVNDNALTVETETNIEASRPYVKVTNVNNTVSDQVVFSFDVIPSEDNVPPSALINEMRSKKSDDAKSYIYFDGKYNLPRFDVKDYATNSGPVANKPYRVELVMDMDCGLDSAGKMCGAYKLLIAGYLYKEGVITYSNANAIRDVDWLNLEVYNFYPGTKYYTHIDNISFTHRNITKAEIVNDVSSVSKYEQNFTDGMSGFTLANQNYGGISKLVDSAAGVPGFENYLSYQYDAKNTLSGAYDRVYNAKQTLPENIVKEMTTGKIVREMDLFIPDLSNCRIEFRVDGVINAWDSSNPVYKNNNNHTQITALSAAMITTYPLWDGVSTGTNNKGLILQKGGKLTVNGVQKATLEANKKYTLKFIYDMDNKTCEAWLDDTCLGKETIHIYSTTSNAPTYCVLENGEYIVKTSTADDFYGVWEFYATSYAYKEGYSTSTMVEIYGIDNVKVYLEFDIPEIAELGFIDGAGIVQEGNIIESDATALTVSLSAKYAASSINEDNIKLLVNGVETEYDNVAYSDDIITVTLNNGSIKKYDSIELVLGENILLIDGKTKIGTPKIASFKVGKAGLWIDAALTDEDGIIKADFKTKNKGSKSQAVVLVCKYSETNELCGIEVKTISIDAVADEEYKVVTPKGTANKVKLMVWNNMDDITPMLGVID